MDQGKGKTYLFIDGSNLYSSQFELFSSEKYLDFLVFIKQVEKTIDVKFDKIYFYASYSPQPINPTHQEKNYLKNEAFFYKSVKADSRVKFFLGYRSKTSGKEKEVDVKLAVDIVDFCHLNLFDNLFLFSGDADFGQALVIAKRFNKDISILSLQNRVPIRFSYNFKTFVFIFKKFYKKKLKFNDKQKIKMYFLDDHETVMRV